jgi:hypothetical protein
MNNGVHSSNPGSWILLGQVSLSCSVPRDAGSRTPFVPEAMMQLSNAVETEATSGSPAPAPAARLDTLFVQLKSRDKNGGDLDGMSFNCFFLPETHVQNGWNLLFVDRSKFGSGPKWAIRPLHMGIHRGIAAQLGGRSPCRGGSWSITRTYSWNPEDSRSQLGDGCRA